MLSTKFKSFIILIAIVLAFGCTAKKPEAPVFFRPFDYFVARDTLKLLDAARNRIIPIAQYETPRRADDRHLKKIVIFNPGYGGKNTDYSYIANKVAQHGYHVIVIQHDLPGDDTLPRTGDIYKLRKPSWDRGVQNIIFVTRYLRRKNYLLDFDSIILIGHSNGGDMAMLIANEYPKFAKAIISLDNRRMPFPRARNPKIFSIRSSDQPADPGVLPSVEEQKKYHIKIVKVNTTHNDMGGMGTEEQKEEINNYIIDFLNNLH